MPGNIEDQHRLDAIDILRRRQLPNNRILHGVDCCAVFEDGVGAGRAASCRMADCSQLMEPAL